MPGDINGGYWEYGTRSLYATEILLGGILLLVIGKFIARVIAAETLLVMSLRQRLLSPAGAMF